MAKSSLPSDLPIRDFPTAAAFEKFLDAEYSTSPGVYVKLAKTSSKFTSIKAVEAVEVALCFGWIDGRANSIDEDWWMVRYTPRRPKSIWSQKNVNTISRLIEEGRMRPSGLAAVEAAEADGRWSRAYAGPATAQVPQDLTKALEECQPAAAFFQSLNKSDRYSLLWRIETAPVKTRSKRIEALIQMMATGKVPGKPEKLPKGTTKTAKTPITRRKL